MLNSASSNQKGALNLLLLVAVVGVLGFLGVMAFSPVKNSLFSTINPKDSSFASGAVDLSLSPSNLTIEAGKTFLVDVAIDAKTEQPTAAEVFVKYNPAVFEATVLEQGSFFTVDLSQSAHNPLIDNTSGTVHFTYGQQPGAYKTGTGSVATIEFKALSSTTAPSPITIDPSSQIAAIGKTGNVIGLLSGSDVTVSPVSNVTKTALFSLSPNSGSSTTGSEIAVNVQVLNPTDDANLFSARLNFDPAKLEVTRIVPSAEFITQWVSGPESFNNANGTVSVIGGVPNPGYKSPDAKTMATVYFKSKTSGTASVNFDGTSAVYRNRDNVDILASSTGGNYTSVGTVPSPTPNPSGSVNPTPTPTPTTSATPGSPSPTASASGTPGACNITGASWLTSANPIVENRIVNLKVVGTGDCVGKEVDLYVFEEDGLFGVDAPANKPTSPIVFGSNNEATGTWMSEFQPDGFGGINNPPEYFFTASLRPGNQLVSASPMLEVTQANPGTPTEGDTNGDNKFDLADLSVLLTNWNKTDAQDAVDTNNDGVINTFDFAYMVQLLKLEGIID